MEKLPLVLHVSRWEEKIPLAKTTLEKTWLFHEIGRCYLELDQAWQAQNYGKKSQQCAKEEGDIEWQLNANVLVAQAQGMGSDSTTLPFPALRHSCHTRAGSAYHPSVSLARLILRVGINPSIEQHVESAYFKLSSVRAWGTLRAALPSTVLCPL